MEAAEIQEGTKHFMSGLRAHSERSPVRVDFFFCGFLFLPSDEKIYSEKKSILRKNKTKIPNTISSQ